MTGKHKKKRFSRPFSSRSALIEPVTPYDIEPHVQLLDVEDEKVMAAVRKRNAALVRKIQSEADSKPLLSLFEVTRTLTGHEKSVWGGRIGALVLDHTVEDPNDQYGIILRPEQSLHRSSDADSLEQITVPMSDETIGVMGAEDAQCVRIIANGLLRYVNGPDGLEQR